MSLYLHNNALCAQPSIPLPMTTMTQADCQTPNGTYYGMTHKGLDALIQEYFDKIQALILLVNV